MKPHFRPRKRFGQHFLTDQTVLEQIAEAIGLAPDDSLIEIGPGKGALTQFLLPRVKHLDAIEIDRDLAAYLETKYAKADNLTIYNADVLHFDWQTLLAQSQRIVGNLPYNITSVLLFKLFAWSSQIKDMHFLLQKEVVERLVAAPGNHHYGRLSVMAQYHCAITLLFTVDAHAFSPPPRVQSAFARFVPHAIPPFKAQDFNLFTALVKEAFCYRRKTLANSLHKFITASALESLNIDPRWRAEQITVENFVKISNILGNGS